MQYIPDPINSTQRNFFDIFNYIYLKPVLLSFSRLPLSLFSIML